MNRPIRSIGICGIGQMGSACAVAFRRAGYDVVLWARDPAKLDAIDAELEAMQRWCDEHLPAAGVSPDRPARGRLTKTRELADLDRDCDVILDCIIEVMRDKIELLSRFELARRRGALFLSATSALSITEMAAGSKLTGLLVGAHFWNPPHIIPVVEMVRGAETPDDRLAEACALMEAIGKIPVVCKDVPGFVGNRLLHAMWREALHIVGDGICSAADLDRIIKLTFALRLPVLGPMENMDYVGLDATERLQRYMGPRLANNTEPEPLLAEKLAAGQLGIKTGEGFYDWSQRDSGEMLRRRDEQVVRQLALLRDLGELP